MQVTFWGTRGSLAAPGPETARYGGNTSCVEVRGNDGTILVLDAGTGIRRQGASLPAGLGRVDLLLTHLHMDHLQGLGFFAPLYQPGMEVHIWGPASPTQNLHQRLTRYLSPPLFPVRLRDVPSRLQLHEVPAPEFTLGEFRIQTALVCHPGPTVGYRIESPNGVLTYIPDHEPALGASEFPGDAAWTSGFALADGADVLIHDAQYTVEEYRARVGWGHSSLEDALAFARLANVKQFVPFHHDPYHDDQAMDAMLRETLSAQRLPFQVTPAAEGATIRVPS